MGNVSIKDNILAIFTPSMLACALAYALLTFSGSLTNAYLYAYVSVTDGWIREASTLVMAVTFLGLTAAAYYRPRIIRSRAVVVLCCAFSLVAVALAAAGFSSGSMMLVSLGIFARSFSRALVFCLFSLCLVQLESGKQVSFAVAFGIFMSSVLDLGKGAIATPLNAMTLMAAIQIAVALWAARPARRVLAITSAADSVDDLKLTDPRAFLPTFHGVFVCILLFSAASGFALTFNEVAGAPATFLFNTPLLALLLVFLLMSWGNKREDLLFSVSVLIVMAGFLTTPLSFDAALANVSGTLLRFGEQCFEVLAWTVVMSIGRRNVYGCLFTVGVMRVMSNVGTIIGAVSGHITNDFVQTDFVMATGFALSMVFAFFAFLWCGFRAFSFSDAIESVMAVSHPVSGVAERAERAIEAARAKSREVGVAGSGGPDEQGVSACVAVAEDKDDVREVAGAPDSPFGGEAVSCGAVSRGGQSPFAARVASDSSTAGYGDSAVVMSDASDVSATALEEPSAAQSAQSALDANCARLGDKFGLTEREREVFLLLAHGRNGRYIMDNLVISRNTAKTHIKHIYSKLGVHSHQELIDLATGLEK